MIQMLGFAASLTVVAGYVQMNRTKNDNWLNWANALCWPFIAFSSAVVGAWPAVIVTVMFGVVGTWGLWKGRKPKDPAKRLAARKGIYFPSAQARLPESARLKAQASLRQNRSAGTVKRGTV